MLTWCEQIHKHLIVVISLWFTGVIRIIDYDV